MKTNIKKRFTTMLLTGALAISVPHWASAAGTVACTVVSNNATVSYSVDGTSQPDVDTTAAPAEFTVGNKVIVTVATSNIAPGVTVVPGKSTAQLIAAQKVLTFTVTNGGNARQDYVLTPTAKASTTPDPFGGANDSFDLTGVTVFVEDGTTPGYQSAEDTATTIDNLDPGAKTVYIVPNGAANTIPAGLADGSTSVYSLLATTYKVDGATLEAEGNASVTSTVGSCNADIVFADTTVGSDDPAEDGQDSDRSTYSVCTANIAVSKTSVVYSDPINGTTLPKAIPGAIVRYTISLQNTGCTSATLTTITDVLSNELQIVSTAAGASWSVAASTRGTTSGTLTADTADAGSDGLGHSNTGAVGGTLTATLTTILAADVPNSYAAGELKTGETVDIVFDVTLQ